jgi:hypothetical protein
MALIPVDLSVFPEAVRKRMHEIWTAENQDEMLKAQIRQQQIAKFYQDHPPHWRDGVGEMEMAVDPYWRGYFAMLHDTGEVWQEKDFRKWLLKNMPEVGVKAVSGKIQVGGRKGLEGVPKIFRKTYENKPERSCPARAART